MQGRNEHPEDLLTTREAAAILSKNAGRNIGEDYVRVLATKRYGRLHPVRIDGRTNLYKRGEVEAIRIGKRPGLIAKAEKK